MLSLGDHVTSWERQHSLWAAARLCLSLTVPRPCRRLQGSVQRPLAPHHVARLPLPLQLGVDPALLPPSHHGDALFFGCLSQADAQPAVSIPQVLQTPPFEQLPQPWALAGSGQPKDKLRPGQMSDCTPSCVPWRPHRTTGPPLAPIQTAQHLCIRLARLPVPTPEHCML